MKKHFFRLALLTVTLCVFLCACASSVEEEKFDADFLGTQSGIDLNGFELVYDFELESVVGFMPDTVFADLARQRIEDVEKQYNCKITINYGAGADFVSASVGGSFMCDVITGTSDRWADAARVGALIGLSELTDFLDYRDEAKWGPRKLLEVVYYEDDLYGVLPFAWPELGFTYFGYPIVVNEDLVVSLAETDPREYIENGTWTWAQFRKCLEAYTKIEGGETVHYGFSGHPAYYAQMFLLSNGSSLVKKVGGSWVSGVSDERAMKAMQEAVDVYYGDLSYTFDKVNTEPAAVVEQFLNGQSVMSSNVTDYIYGLNASISQNMKNFGILKWPVGPDVDPNYTFSIYSNNKNCISFSVLSRDPDKTAMIVNAIYEPLPGYETSDDIKNFLSHSYFFDERDCDTFLGMYVNQNYNYFHYGMREVMNSFFGTSNTIAAAVEKNETALQNSIDRYVVPSVSAIEALWGSYD